MSKVQYIIEYLCLNKTNHINRISLNKTPYVSIFKYDPRPQTKSICMQKKGKILFKISSLPKVTTYVTLLFYVVTIFIEALTITES